MEDGFLLYKGAICCLDLHKGTKSMPFRDNLIDAKILKKSGNHYVLQTNKMFSSVSAATEEKRTLLATSGAKQSIESFFSSL